MPFEVIKLIFINNVSSNIVLVTEARLPDQMPASLGCNIQNTQH